MTSNDVKDNIAMKIRSGKLSLVPVVRYQRSRAMRKPDFGSMRKTKAEISCAIVQADQSLWFSFK